MLVNGVPRNPPPLGLSFDTIILYHIAHAMGSFDDYLDTSRDYATWFVESFARPISRDVPVSGGRVLRGIIHA